MKTANEWFNDLADKDLAKKILKNTTSDVLEKKYSWLSEALMDAFIWSDTSEGFNFWDDVHEEFLELENHPKKYEREVF